MKKGDFLIFAAIAVVFAASVFLIPFKKGNSVIVKQDNEIVYEGSLKEDTEVKLKGNTLIVKNGEVYMKEANCKNGICVHTGRISEKGESIICLPNRVVAEIK